MLTDSTHPLTANPDTLAHSQQLIGVIVAEIQQQPLTFQRFMELALYAPGLGYYSAGCQKFGSAGGDFTTAPEISPLFAQCLAQQVMQVLSSVTDADILEFGAGTGALAADLLMTLEQMDCLPNHYYILDISPDLQQRQRETLQQRCPQLAERVVWLQTLPEQFRGVVIANEVLDAMPVLRFQTNGDHIHEYCVAWDGNDLQWQTRELEDTALVKQIQQLKHDYFPEVEHYSSELNTFAKPWLSSLAESLQQGAVLLIDYGFPAHEFYHPQRSTGTLMCHYHHHSHDNPLLLTGLQDITSHVDFTAIAEHALACGLDVAGYTNQANFLINCGLTSIVSHSQMSPQQLLDCNRAIKLLTLPSEMGELFKVMAFSKNLDDDLIGFINQDKRHSL